MEKSKKKSPMWLHFEKVGDGKVVCNYCSGEFKYSKNTSNMKDHVKRKHPEKLQIPSTSNVDINFDKSLDTENPNSAIEFYNVNSTRKKMLDLLYTQMIARDMEPLRLCEREGFKKFIAALDSKYQLPSRYTISTKLLPKLHAIEKLKLHGILQKVHNIALTTDMWTSKSNQGICAVTAHFIRNQKLEAALLETVVMEERHTADNIAAVSTIICMLT
jgi:hypothetical protein